jgi:hypothetical protein
MNQWSADFANDPNDDYNLIIEILYDGEYVAVIKQSQQGLTMTWYPNKKPMTIPVDWLSKLFLEAKQMSARDGCGLQ